MMVYSIPDAIRYSSAFLLATVARGDGRDRSNRLYRCMDATGWSSFVLLCLLVSSTSVPTFEKVPQYYEFCGSDLAHTRASHIQSRSKECFLRFFCPAPLLTAFDVPSEAKEGEKCVRYH